MIVASVFIIKGCCCSSTAKTNNNSIQLTVTSARPVVATDIDEEDNPIYPAAAAAYTHSPSNTVYVPSPAPVAVPVVYDTNGSYYPNPAPPQLSAEYVDTGGAGQYHNYNEGYAE